MTEDIIGWGFFISLAGAWVSFALMFFERKKCGWLLIIFGIIFSFFAYEMIKMIIENKKEKECCGKVVKVYQTPAGYKVQPTNHIVFYNNALKRNIDVKITYNSYANMYVNKFVCFDLNKNQLEE